MSTESQIIIEPMTSDALKDNPLGDSPRRYIPIYLPPGYDKNETLYPVIYLLTGFTGRGQMLLNDSTFDESIQERLDRLIITGQIQPVIVVMPDCLTRYGGSQYINSGATGRYEDYLISELIPFIDQRYPTYAEAGYRAIAGKSSGGYGALIQAMHHPEIFSIIACHSGDMYFDYCYKPDFVKFLNAAGRLSINSVDALREFLDNFSPKMYPKPANFFDIIHMAAMSACYSPNLDSPCNFDLPFDLTTGELRNAVWQRWLDQDPITMLQDDKHIEAFHRMKLIYLDCGNHDEYALQYGARIFCHRLEQFNIPYIYEEFDGGHRHTQFRYDVSFRAIAQAFED